MDQNKYRAYFLERKLRMLTEMKERLSETEVELNKEIKPDDNDRQQKFDAVFMAAQEARKEIRESYNKAITELYDLREKLAPPLPDNPFLFKVD